MEDLPAGLWAVIGLVVTAVTGAITFLAKPALEAARERAKQDAILLQRRQEKDAEEVETMRALHIESIEVNTAANRLNAESNAKVTAVIEKQANVLETLAKDVAMATTSLALVVDSTRTIHSAVTEGAEFMKMLVDTISDQELRHQAEESLEKVIDILNRKKF